MSRLRSFRLLPNGTLYGEALMLSSLTQELQNQVRDLYSAEVQLVKALPKVAKAASTESLRKAFEDHLVETKTHVARLEKVAELLECKPGGKTCKAMQGLIAEGKEAIEEEGEKPVLDVALIAAAQRIEHYEIAAYGTARAIAEHLERKDIAKLLQQTLDEEGAADKALTAISQDEVFAAASLGSAANDAPTEPTVRAGAMTATKTATKPAAKTTAKKYSGTTTSESSRSRSTRHGRSANEFAIPTREKE
jgi:ferritin-like metal-binding protein YciE